MIPQHWIEAYLRFLLRSRGAVTVVVAAVTLFFAYQLGHMRLHTDFFDFYPRFRTFADAFVSCREFSPSNPLACAFRAAIKPGSDPYIQTYIDFRRMFGSANIMSVILEVQRGDIFNPTTLQKLDRITKYVNESKGVNPQQVLSIAHPRVRSITSRAGAIQIREMYYPGIPRSAEDAEAVRFRVYSTPGVRGIFTSLDDTAAVVYAGFWEEALDFEEMYQRMMALKEKEEDDNHRIYFTGFPWLYTSVLRYWVQVVVVFACTAVALSFLLFVYFRTWTGIWVPVFSGLLSGIWGLGIAVSWGFNLDPLVLVIPIFLTARALSHSVQSMDRYHEEYYRCRNQQNAIVNSYSRLFPPAIASIVTDGIGLLVVAVAPIPLVQKVAIFASFWVVSIFVSVVTLHPILLSFLPPPPDAHALIRPPALPLRTATLILGAACLLAAGVYMSGRIDGGMAVAATAPVMAWYWWSYADKVYPAITRFAILANQGRRRWTVLGAAVVLFIGGWSWGRTLRVGDMTPGAALLFPDHPYNVAYRKLNEKFLGASQIIVIADTKRPDGIKNPASLAVIEEFADYMSGARGASRSVTVTDLVKTLARLYHDGDPKWGLIPESPKEIGQLFYVFTSAASGGELDRFMDPSGRYATVLTLFRGYSHKIIMDSIAHGKRFSSAYPDSEVEFRFAGGLFGVLAAVNQAVENSYWTNLGLIFAIIYFCLYLTYGSHAASAILMVPVLLSQVLAEALMVGLHIDLNVNSLPIAAAGAGVGVDYGIYLFSRVIDTYHESGDMEQAVDRAIATTGKAILFTGSTMIAGTVFWWFSALKFQAEMGFLLAFLMAFNMFGGLVVVPAIVKTLRPGFLVGGRTRTAEDAHVK